MEEKKTVLIIEDELNIRDLIETFLSKNGFVTVGVESAELGLKKIPVLKPSLILLDIQLPNMDGLEACRRIRQDPRAKNIPIILVSVQSSDIHKIIGLESGADDFVAKPFNPAELLARVNAVLRRFKPADKKTDKMIEDWVFTLNMETHTAYIKKNKLDMTPKEFTLLSLFIKEKGNVLTRDVISTQIWERENLETSRTIDVHIGRLRKKLGKYADAIETVGKVGYRYNPT
jgi:DNA-binding response OmpR family regulator